MPDGTLDPSLSESTRQALAARFPATLFPCERDRLIEEAEVRFADSDLVAALRQMPAGSYGSLDEVCVALERAVGGIEP
jgi:hypothetical protein